MVNCVHEGWEQTLVLLRVIQLPSSSSSDPAELCWHRNTLQGARYTALGVELPSEIILWLALSSAFSHFATKAVELSSACPCSHRENLRILLFCLKQTQLKKILVCFFFSPSPHCLQFNTCMLFLMFSVLLIACTRAREALEAGNGI